VSNITMHRAPTLTPEEARRRRHQVYALLREIGQRARTEREQKADSTCNLGGDAALSACGAVQSTALDARSLSQ